MYCIYTLKYVHRYACIGDVGSKTLLSTKTSLILNNIINLQNLIFSAVFKHSIKQRFKKLVGVCRYQLTYIFIEIKIGAQCLECIKLAILLACYFFKVFIHKYQPGVHFVGFCNRLYIRGKHANNRMNKRCSGCSLSMNTSVGVE